MKRRSTPPESAYTLVYSTDGAVPKRCSGCRRELASCVCDAPVDGEMRKALKPLIRIERKGRGGKTVTVIGRLPPRKSFLKELCSHLKRSIGGGGTSYIEGDEGFIEIQGEHVDQVRRLVQEYCSAN